MSEQNKNKKTSRRVFWTRVACLILAAVMIGSVCYLAIQLIIDSIKEKKEHEGHSHAGLDPTVCYYTEALTDTSEDSL